VVRKVIGEEEAQIDDSGWGMQVGETIAIPGTGWRPLLERSDAKRATFRIAKGQPVPPRE
jgi:hypothetical protein